VNQRASLAVALLLAFAACSSSSNPSGGNGTGSDGGGEGNVPVDATEADASEAADTGAPSQTDAPVNTGGDGGGDAAGVSAAVAPAGKAGVDAFCTQICNHEQRCATALDASPSGLSGCVTNCQAGNEAATANPPTELLRTDYVAALGSCIAASSCTDALQTSEATCGESILLGNSDAGIHALAPTQAVAVFCHDLETSPCTSADSGTQDCVSTFMFYSDVTLTAAISCFSDATCSAVATCYSAAFMQP
jgi:hypothetical protein